MIEESDSCQGPELHHLQRVQTGSRVHPTGRGTIRSVKRSERYVEPSPYLVPWLRWMKLQDEWSSTATHPCGFMVWKETILSFNFTVSSSVLSINNCSIRAFSTTITAKWHLFLNNQSDALIVQIFSVIKLYMFGASSLPIISSHLLCIRHW
jgi:hypothetical protein